MINEEVTAIFDELVSVYHNLKAEVIVTEVNKGREQDVDFLIRNNSTFSRSYRRDIIDVENHEDENYFLLNLSRNGLYDSLPEGLFHDGKGYNANDSFTAKRKKYKEEEKNTRTFFSPIENEFFNQRLYIEENERELLENFYNLEDEFLINFWNIDKSIPRTYMLKLIKLLPYCFAIAGDLELARLSLENNINQTVQFKMKYEGNVKLKTDKIKELGVNFITHSKKSQIVQPYLEVTIGPIKDNEIDHFIKNVGVQKFLTAFYDYFLPLELEVKTKYTSNNEDGFILNEKQDAIIGLTTRI